MSAFGDLGSATRFALREFSRMLDGALEVLVSSGVDKARIDLARDAHTGVEWIRVDGTPRFKASIELDGWTVTVRGEWIGEMP